MSPLIVPASHISAKAVKNSTPAPLNFEIRSAECSPAVVEEDEDNVTPTAEAEVSLSEHLGEKKRSKKQPAAPFPEESDLETAIGDCILISEEVEKRSELFSFSVLFR